ncbi:hypothetical protein OAC70_00035 [Flavobacteriaceae bacterium]|jgi:hypothetical protein|nr:hypothetical protein [Flavobacteriaceae bacterium]MDA9886041.1 hypothetical protein [Flavobacteriaceae bacterium]MDB2673210.1 hypothetical protein [Flavobacteriaceae bacterium]MDB9885795.1 hypothetical protein [Flavobacteriaceae bacterium]
MKFLFLSLVLTFVHPRVPAQDDCRVRLRYFNFDTMTEQERLLWLNCAFEKLKTGDDGALIRYKEWSGTLMSYPEFKALWEKKKKSSS